MPFVGKGQEIPPKLPTQVVLQDVLMFTLVVSFFEDCYAICVNTDVWLGGRWWLKNSNSRPSNCAQLIVGFSGWNHLEHFFMALVQNS